MIKDNLPSYQEIDCCTTCCFGENVSGGAELIIECIYFSMPWIPVEVNGKCDFFKK